MVDQPQIVDGLRLNSAKVIERDGSRVVMGSLCNLTGRDLAFVTVTFTWKKSWIFFGGGSAIASMRNLVAGQTWNFNAECPRGTVDDFENCKVKAYPQELVVEEDSWHTDLNAQRWITATATNYTGRNLDLATVSWPLFDVSGCQVGNATDSIQHLADGAKWNLKVPCLVEGATKFGKPVTQMVANTK